MLTDAFRTLRLRLAELQEHGPKPGRLRSSELDNAPPPETPRFVGRVLNAGAIPTRSERVFRVNPVRLEGGEIEGANASISTDASRSIPVVVVGSNTPKAGDMIIAYASGGRWISELGGQPATVACGTCTIPRRDLTLTWTNSLLGTHSGSMTFNGVDEWTTGCINQLVFRLSCRSSTVTFLATYFVNATCPNGQLLTCTSPGSSPLGLGLTIQSCSPFLLQYSTSSCPALLSLGYMRFTVTQ